MRGTGYSLGTTWSRYLCVELGAIKKFCTNAVRKDPDSSSALNLVPDDADFIGGMNNLNGDRVNVIADDSF